MQRALMILAVFASWTAIVGATTTAKEEPKSPAETRRHFALRSHEHDVICEGTEVLQYSNELDRRTYILTCGTRAYVINSTWDYKTHIFSRDIRVPGADGYLRSTYTHAGDYSSRSELIDFIHSHPEQRNADVEVKVETSGAAYTAKDSEWQRAPASRHWRRALRAGMSPTFRDAVEALSDLSIEDAADLRLDLEPLAYVIYRHSCEAPIEARFITLVGDCTFDKSAGFPCTDKQLRHLADNPLPASY